MAVRIPQYDQRTNPEGLIAANAHSEFAAGDVGAQMSRLGSETAQTAGIGMHIISEQKNALHEKQAADAHAANGKLISDSYIKWNQYLDKAKESSPDGAHGLTGNTIKEYDAWAEATLGNQPNEVARKHLATNLLSLRTSLATEAMNYEAKAGVADRNNKTEQAYQNYSGLVQTGKMPFSVAHQQMTAMIDGSGYDPVSRAELKQKYSERLAEATLTGQADRDPAATKQALTQIHGGGFEDSVGFTLKHEGGLNASDTNGTPSNFGINQAAHPKVDVKNITQGQAKQIYKSDYWDKINGDELTQSNPGLAKAAFDTAVIAGTGKAKELLTKAGGDVNKFMDLRENFLSTLLQKNPDKYGKYQKAWSNRNADLRAGTGQIAPDTEAAIKSLNVDRVGQFINYATAEQNRQQSTYRAQMGTVEADHLAAFTNGQTVQTPLSHSDYVRAYGDVEGNQRFEQYQNNMQLGADIQTVKPMPLAQQADFLAAKKPDPGAPGYDMAIKRYDILASAIDGVNKSRAADPMAYAQAGKLGGIEPLDFSSTDKFGEQLSKRIGIAKEMNTQYGSPLLLMSKAESEAMVNGLNQMTSSDKLAYIKSISQHVQDPVAYRAVMQQIAPDSPVSAMAGIIAQKQNSITVPHMFGADEVYKQGDVAATLLEGEALINPNKADKATEGNSKFKLPEDKEFQQAFSSKVGTAFANSPNSEAYSMQAVKAYYAGKSAREGDYSGIINQDRLQQSITAVTGGVTNVNGKGEVLRPWGMDETSFNNGINAAFDQKMNAMGKAGKPDARFSLYGLQSAGDSRYLLKSGTGYLNDANGQPVVLDLMTKSDATPTTQAPSYSDIQVDPSKQDQSSWEKRSDGSSKGNGFLGLLKRPDGGVSSEISISTDAIGGKDFPLLVPTLSRKEVDQILAVPVDDPNFFKKIPREAIFKAEDYAKQRVGDGKSPFASPEESPQYQASLINKTVEKTDKLSPNKMKTR